MDSEDVNNRFIASLFASLPAPIVAFDRNDSVTAWNPAAERLFGWTAEEVLGKSYALVPEKGEAQYSAAINRVIKGASIPQYKASRRRKDGSLVDVSIALAPIRNTKGEITGALAVFNDITEQRVAEEDRRKSEHELAERIKELSCFYRIAELVEKPGISLEEILKGAVEFIPSSRQRPEVTCARIVLDGQEYKTRNFKETHWKQSCDIIVHGEKVGSVEVCYLEKMPETDEGPFTNEERHLIDAISARLGRIVERIRATESLQETKRRLSTLISNLPGMVYRCRNDINWTMEYVSKGCLEITGYSCEELVGEKPHRAYSDLINQQDRKVVWKKIQAAVTAKEPFRLVYRIRDANGEERYLLEKGRGVYEKNGNLQNIEGFITDVTSLKTAEAEARIQSEQLLQADKMVALGTLVSGVGHEINNPNNFVMLNVPLLKGMWKDAIPILEKHFQEKGDFNLRRIPFSKAGEMIPQLLDDILEGAWRIKRIVGELKDYARPQPAVTTELVDINDVVRSAIVLCNTFIKQHTQNFSSDYSDDLPQIKGSGQRIEQVVINLLQNACEALENNKNAVSISTSYDRESDGVVIAVEDEGKGIAEKDLFQITDPFFTTKREAGGTGLGLSITQRIVQNYEGTLTFESARGKGTLFRVFLPRDFESQQGKK